MTIAGSAPTPKLDRKRASRVALDPTWNAMLAAAVTVAARTAERVSSEVGLTGAL